MTSRLKLWGGLLVLFCAGALGASLRTRCSCMLTQPVLVASMARLPITIG
jgi:hypothetical protein